MQLPQRGYIGRSLCRKNIFGPRQRKRKLEEDDEWVMQDCVDDIEEDPLPSDDLELSPPPLQPYERPHKRLKVPVYESSPAIEDSSKKIVHQRREKTSKFVGVFWDSTTRKWKAQLYNNKEKRYLGLYKSELRAAGAVNWMCKVLRIDFVNPGVDAAVPSPVWAQDLEEKLGQGDYAAVKEILLKSRSAKEIKRKTDILPTFSGKIAPLKAKKKHRPSKFRLQLKGVRNKFRYRSGFQMVSYRGVDIPPDQYKNESIIRKKQVDPAQDKNMISNFWRYMSMVPDHITEECQSLKELCFGMFHIQAGEETWNIIRRHINEQCDNNAFFEKEWREVVNRHCTLFSDDGAVHVINDFR